MHVYLWLTPHSPNLHEQKSSREFPSRGGMFYKPPVVETLQFQIYECEMGWILSA